MPDYIPISQLNDFIFCPYSIYLHNVYMDADEDLYHAEPQTRGKIAHSTVDKKTYSSKSNDILALPVFSQELGVMGKIDLFKQEEGLLIERKYQLKQIYQGQIYQLWAQYFCMVEMGYIIKKIAFYEISTNKMLYQNIPLQKDKNELISFIDDLKSFNPASTINVNANKCAHCIYNALCDKTEVDNVYS